MRLLSKVNCVNKKDKSTINGIITNEILINNGSQIGGYEIKTQNSFVYIMLSDYDINILG